MTAGDLPVLRCGVDPDAPVRRVAVTAAGRREADEAVAASLVALAPGAAVLLEHGGPATSRWSIERAVAHIDDVVDPQSGRRARGLGAAGLEELIAAWAAAAAHVRALGGQPMVAAVDDDLLHRALSPLGGGGGGDALVLAILKACAPCDLALTVEDLAPGGLTPSAGVAFARRAIEVAGASRLVAAGGTGWLEPLRSRRKGARADTRGVSLASAVWCVGAVPVPVWGYVRGEFDDETLRLGARRAGLAGVLRAGSLQPGSP